MKKLILLLAIVALLAGCSPKTTTLTYKQVNDVFTMHEFCNMDIYYNSSGWSVGMSYREGQFVYSETVWARNFTDLGEAIKCASRKLDHLRKANQEECQ